MARTTVSSDTPQVLAIPDCLADPNIKNFNISGCPSLLAMLDAYALGNNNPPASCEMSCVHEFIKVGWVGGERRVRAPPIPPPPTRSHAHSSQHPQGAEHA